MPRTDPCPPPPARGAAGAPAADADAGTADASPRLRTCTSGGGLPSPYSKYPPCLKDVSFWLPKEGDSFTENNLCEVVRDVAGSLVEEVKLIDEFTNPKKGLTSNCYRIVYRSMERSLTDEEINALQEKVREDMVSKLGVELR